MWKAVKAQMSEQEQHQESPENNDDEGFDFTHVNSVARIALYDNLLSAPRVTEIQPAPTGEFIESLATNVYQQSQAAGGTIPYTVIREVSENFIHARFQEATVSILDHGCTIRFADQGPGIACKDRAQLPGFTSAIEPMKSYIRGVGSGLPIVKEYLDFTHGTISIEDNLGTGSVVTISANGSNPQLPKELEIDHVEEDESAEHPRTHGAALSNRRGGSRTCIQRPARIRSAFGSICTGVCGPAAYAGIPADPTDGIRSPSAVRTARIRADRPAGLRASTYPATDGLPLRPANAAATTDPARAGGCAADHRVPVPAREGLPRHLHERRGAGRIGRSQTDRSGAVERA